MRFNNQPAPLTIRANTLKNAPEVVTERLSSAGVRVEPTKFALHGLVVRQGNPLLSSACARRTVLRAGRGVADRRVARRRAERRPGARRLRLARWQDDRDSGRHAGPGLARRDGRSRPPCRSARAYRPGIRRWLREDRARRCDRAAVRRFDRVAVSARIRLGSARRAVLGARDDSARSRDPLATLGRRSSGLRRTAASDAA